MTHDNQIEAYIRWRNGLEESDYPALYRSLARLGIIEELIEKGATNEQISTAVFELD